jgi:hypothetical protein
MNVDIALTNIEEVEFFYKNSVINVADFDVKNLQMHIDLRKNLDLNLNLVNIQMTISYAYHEVEALKLKVKIDFALPQLPNIITQIGNNWQLPEAIDTILQNISYSTVRGFLAAKTQGLPLNKFYMPIVDPQQFANA